jgi:maleylacetate reductase
MRSFTHVTLGQRVLFGSGRSAENVRAEVERLGARAVMVIAAPSETGIADAVTAGIDVALRHGDVTMHVPVASAEKARAAAAEHAVDLLLSIGGGSTTGLAKAVALTSGLPIVAVPTTYAGSEATDVWGLTDSAGKTTGSDQRVLPVSVVYDAAHTLSLPVDLSVASGLNALAHCVDSMWAPRADPINAALAGEGIRALAVALPAIARDPLGVEGRERALYGAYLSAVAFASAGSGLHHKICHVLGGAYNLPHAQTHAAVLPHVLRFNGPAVPKAEARMATAFGARSAGEGLERLCTELSARWTLKDLGLGQAELDTAAELVMPVVPPSNPRPVTVHDLVELLRAAWAGNDRQFGGSA